jgi:hypothetical protein
VPTPFVGLPSAAAPSLQHRSPEVAPCVASALSSVALLRSPWSLPLHRLVSPTLHPLRLRCRPCSVFHAHHVTAPYSVHREEAAEARVCGISPSRNSPRTRSRYGRMWSASSPTFGEEGRIASEKRKKTPSGGEE